MQGAREVEAENTIQTTPLRDQLDVANLHWKLAPNFGQDSGGGLNKFTHSGIDDPVPILRRSPIQQRSWPPSCSRTGPHAALWAVLAVGGGVMWLRDRHCVS